MAAVTTVSIYGSCGTTGPRVRPARTAMVPATSTVASSASTPHPDASESTQP